MSVNYNRAIVKSCTNNSYYRKKQIKWMYPPYWDEGCLYLYPAYRRGYKNPHKYVFPGQRRMYRTWKHNRKTQWKIIGK